MFKIDPDPTFTAPVPLSRPGVSDPINVLVTFRHKNRDALTTWLAKKGKVDDVELLGEVIEKWSGLQTAEGEEVAFSATTLSTLLANYTPARHELFRSYLNELTDSKRKNS
jgi:hypothetical protein